MTWGWFLFLLALLYIAIQHTVEWWIKWRPRRKAYKQVREGSRWLSGGTSWIIGARCGYTWSVAMHIESNPGYYMIVGPDYVLERMEPLPAKEPA